MNFVEKIANLRKQEQAINDKVEDLIKALEYDEWIFCIHVHYEDPRVSMWKYSDGADTDVTLIVKDGYAKMCNSSMGKEDWQEAEGILNKCLAQNFSNELEIREE